MFAEFSRVLYNQVFYSHYQGQAERTAAAKYEHS